MYQILKSLTLIDLNIFLIVCQKFYGSRDISHAPFGETYLCFQLAFHMRSYWPNLKSLAQVVLKICSIVCRVNWRVTWPRRRPFWGKLLACPLGFSKSTTFCLFAHFVSPLCTKFKVSSSNSFGDMFDCMPKILEVTWPRPRPLWGKLFEHPLGFSKRMPCTKFKVSSSSSFEDIFHCMPKIEGSRDVGHDPFGENYFSAHSVEVSSSSSSEDMFNRIPNILGVMLPRPRTLCGKFCIFLFRFAKT